jgi:hypothetical protein
MDISLLHALSPISFSNTAMSIAFASAFELLFLAGESRRPASDGRELHRIFSAIMADLARDFWIHYLREAEKTHSGS